MRRRTLGWTAACWLAWHAPAGAAEPAPFSARAGEDLARDAAAAWADDAQLVWVENDEPILGAGAAARWGYLFYSPARDVARGYSVEGGEIRVARDLPFAFPAPPIADGWIDSERALAAAESAGGTRFREERGAHVRTMLLVRGVLQQEKPDLATWAVVYEAADEPGLWVLVDASSGKVVRTWRG